MESSIAPVAQEHDVVVVHLVALLRGGRGPGISRKRQGKVHVVVSEGNAASPRHVSGAAPGISCPCIDRHPHRLCATVCPGAAGLRWRGFAPCKGKKAEGFLPSVAAMSEEPSVHRHPQQCN